MERRLAAILAADVVDYRRLMQADETGTHAAIKARRTAILQPLITKHCGRVFKLMGDGVPMEFASADHQLLLLATRQLAALRGEAATRTAIDALIGSLCMTSPFAFP
jgi:class 3 adenylate cyclase